MSHMAKRKGNYKPGPGRPKNGDYPKQIVARVSEDAYQHVTARAAALNISAAEYLRRLIEADMEGEEG